MVTIWQLTGNWRSAASPDWEVFLLLHQLVKIPLAGAVKPLEESRFAPMSFFSAGGCPGGTMAVGEPARSGTSYTGMGRFRGVASRKSTARAI